MITKNICKRKPNRYGANYRGTIDLTASFFIRPILAVGIIIAHPREWDTLAYRVTASKLLRTTHPVF